MQERPSRRQSLEKYPVRDLSYITSQGGRIRRNLYFREIRIFLLPVILSIFLQAVVYIGVILRVRRDDWPNILIVVAALACVSMVSAAMLAAFRRHGSPLFTASIVTGAWFSVVVSALSAWRIPLSYNGLAACLPVALAVMAFANVRFQRTVNAWVALAPFAQADEVARKIGNVPVLSGPDADISNVEILLIDPREHHDVQWSTLLAKCYLSGVEIMPWTRYLEVRHGRLDVSSFDVSHLVYSPSQLIYARFKRIFDIALVLISLVVALPIALLVAGYIGLRDGSPIYFVQIRRGYGGRRFRMYKFRTMFKGSEGGSTSIHDDRIIPGCHLIRKFRLDEIPQLYNILRGDMSLIGPRPVAEYVARSSAAMEPKYELRTLVLPGITGWAQVQSGYAATTNEEIEKLSYDLYYIKHLSFDLDLVILFKTIRTVLLGFGAR